MTSYPATVQSSGKIKRGPVVSVAERTYTEPIPDDILAEAERIGLVLDDSDHNVIAYRAGVKCGAVWGPAVEGHWFAYGGPAVAADQADVQRVADRDEGLRHMLAASALDDVRGAVRDELRSEQEAGHSHA